MSVGNGDHVRRVSVLLVTLLAFFSVCIGVTATAGEAPQISIFSCVIGANAANHLGVRVRFRNDSPENLTAIVWRAHIGNSWGDLRDEGAFASGATFTRTIVSRFVDATAYYRDDVGNCSVVETESASGTRWSVPGFDASVGAFAPTPRPSDAVPVPASIDNPTNDPIGIVSCAVGIRAGRPHAFGTKDGNAILAVRFRNLSAQTIDRVVFRAPYLGGGIDFVYNGSFAPEVLISSDTHVFGTDFPGGRLMRNLPVETPADYSSPGDDPSNCITVTVHYVGGETWQNPSAGPTEPPLPTAPPTLPPN